MIRKTLGLEELLPFQVRMSIEKASTYPKKALLS